MKSLFAILIVMTFFIFTNVFAQETKGQDAFEKKISDLLKKMTIEEKIGQMNQVTLEAVSKPRKFGSFVNELDKEKLETAILKYHVGSILNTGGQANTLENWNEMITQIQDISNQTRLKIPVIYGVDAIHGASYTKGATLFPQSIAMAATSRYCYV